MRVLSFNQSIPLLLFSIVPLFAAFFFMSIDFIFWALVGVYFFLFLISLVSAFINAKDRLWFLIGTITFIVGCLSIALFFLLVFNLPLFLKLIFLSIILIISSWFTYTSFRKASVKPPEIIGYSILHRRIAVVLMTISTLLAIVFLILSPTAFIFWFGITITAACFCVSALISVQHAFNRNWAVLGVLGLLTLISTTIISILLINQISLLAGLISAGIGVVMGLSLCYAGFRNTESFSIFAQFSWAVCFMISGMAIGITTLIFFHTPLLYLTGLLTGSGLVIYNIYLSFKSAKNVGWFLVTIFGFSVAESIGIIALILQTTSFIDLSLAVLGIVFSIILGLIGIKNALPDRKVKKSRDETTQVESIISSKKLAKNQEKLEKNQLDNLVNDLLILRANSLMSPSWFPDLKRPPKKNTENSNSILQTLQNSLSKFKKTFQANNSGNHTIEEGKLSIIQDNKSVKNNDEKYEEINEQNNKKNSMDEFNIPNLDNNITISYAPPQPKPLALKDVSTEMVGNQSDIYKVIIKNDIPKGIIDGNDPPPEEIKIVIKQARYINQNYSRPHIIFQQQHVPDSYFNLFNMPICYAPLPDKQKYLKSNESLNDLGIHLDTLDYGVRFNLRTDYRDITYFCIKFTIKELDLQIRQKLIIYLLFYIVYALSILHENNIVHRDLMPSNIFLFSKGDLLDNTNPNIADKLNLHIDQKQMLVKLSDLDTLEETNFNGTKKTNNQIEFISTIIPPELLGTAKQNNPDNEKQTGWILIKKNASEELVWVNKKAKKNFPNFYQNLDLKAIDCYALGQIIKYVMLTMFFDLPKSARLYKQLLHLSEKLTHPNPQKRANIQYVKKHQLFKDYKFTEESIITQEVFINGKEINFAHPDLSILLEPSIYDIYILLKKIPSINDIDEKIKHITFIIPEITKQIDSNESTYLKPKLREIKRYLQAELKQINAANNHSVLSSDEDSKQLSAQQPNLNYKSNSNNSRQSWENSNENDDILSPHNNRSNNSNKQNKSSKNSSSGGEDKLVVLDAYDEEHHKDINNNSISRYE